METTLFVDGDVEVVTEAVWSSILGLELDRATGFGVVSATLPCAAIVQVAGNWNGAVLLRCENAVSRRFASILLGTDEPTPDERGEALGEVAQLVAGNIKSLLPGPSKRSLTTVFDGGDCQVRVPGSRVIADVSFRSEGDPVRITVYQQND